VKIRKCLAPMMIVLFAGIVHAQDMPLSQILPDGQTWRPLKQLPDAPSVASVGSKMSQYLTRLPDGSGMFATVKGEPAVYFLPTSGEPKRIEIPLKEPTGMVLWNDGGTLVVADAGGKHLWAFRITKDHSLVDGEKYYPLRVRKGTERSEATALTIDPMGRVYANASEGVHVYDPTGRLCGVLLKPTPDALTAIELDGTKLLVECGGKWYERTLKADGLNPPTPKKK